MVVEFSFFSIQKQVSTQKLVENLLKQTSNLPKDNVSYNRGILFREFSNNII